MPPPLSASNFGQKCSRPRGTRHRRLWAWLAEQAGCRCRLGPAPQNAFQTPATPAALSHVPPS